MFEEQLQEIPKKESQYDKYLNDKQKEKDDKTNKELVDKDLLKKRESGLKEIFKFYSAQLTGKINNLTFEMI